MAKEDLEILKQFCEGIEEEYRKRIPRVSGATADSLEVNVTETYGELRAAAYIGVLEDGRAPTRNSSGKGESLREKILEWITLAGIVPFANEQGVIPTDEQLSWAIATKIHKEGNLLYRKGGKSGVLSNVVTDSRLKALLGAFGDRYSFVTSEVFDKFAKPNDINL